MCFACVNPGNRPASSSAQDPAEPTAWTFDDTARAATVWQQLPRWSRRLLTLLSSAPGHKFPLCAVQQSLITAGEAPFGVAEACDWAAVFCAASGRPLPVRQETLATGETVYWMEQPAALLFQGVIAHPPA